jgi:hypothetical protein
LLALFAVKLPYFVRHPQPEMHRNFLGHASVLAGAPYGFFFSGMFRQYSHPLAGQLLLALRLFHRHQD